MPTSKNWVGRLTHQHLLLRYHLTQITRLKRPSYKSRSSSLVRLFSHILESAETLVIELVKVIAHSVAKI